MSGRLKNATVFELKWNICRFSPSLLGTEMDFRYAFLLFGIF